MDWPYNFGIWDGVGAREGNAERLNGRGGGIRTPDPLLPKQMRYQTALRPDESIVSQRLRRAPVFMQVRRSSPVQKPQDQ